MFSLIYPWLLVLGALLTALPILIHLFNKTKYRVEPWGAMMFLEKAMQVRSQRIKLEQMVLLVLRCLFLLLLALAFSRPISRWGKGAWDDATTYLLIFDDSYSMQQGEGSENAFAKAREAGLAIVESMRNRDNMLIIRAGNAPRSLFSRPSFDQTFLREQIKAMDAGTDQTMDLPKAFDQAWYILGRSAQPRHRVVILTDGQREGWRPDDSKRWTKVQENRTGLKISPHVYVLAQSPTDEIENIAVRALYPTSPVVDIFRTTTFLVELNNTSDSTRNLSLEFLVDGETQAERQVDCPQGQHSFEFQHRFNVDEAALDHPTSSHFVEVRIDNDDLKVDNRYNLALQVSHSIPVLVVDGGIAEDLWESEGGMLARALTAAGEIAAGPASKANLFHVDHVGMTEAEELSLMELEHYRCVVLANIPSFSRNLQFALEQFVEHGGGLFLGLGDAVQPETYHKLTDDEGKGLLPLRIEKQVHLEAGDAPFVPRFPAGASAGVLDLFDTSRERLLDEVRTRAYWQTTPEPGTSVIARFGEAPFILHRSYGQGKVVVWNTSLNLEWTTFPVTQDFLPLVQNLVLFLSSQANAPVNLAQADTLVYSRCQDGSASDRSNAWEFCTIIDPGGNEHKVLGEFIGGEWVAEWQNTTTAGIYTVRMPGRDDTHYAVALQPSEADLTRLEDGARDDFVRLGQVSRFVDEVQGLERAIQEETGEREWWRWLIFLALGVLCTELFLGWRFSS